MMDLDRILQGDALDVLRTLPDNSIDAIVTDPPFGMDYQSARRTDKAKRKPKIANDKRPFIWWLWDAYRVTKPGGALLCMTDWKHQEAFRFAIDIAGFTVRSQVIWDREWHGLGDLEAAFAPQHDVIWFATKGRYKFANGRPRSVVRSLRIAAEELKHPNEKPVSLMRQLVRAVAPLQGIVLDPFAGSGSTCEAAYREGRHFLGIECHAPYVKHALARLEAARATPELWLTESAA